MAERPANVRTARHLERTHNSRRHQAESGGEETRGADHVYRGSHRAERMHRADETHSPAAQRSSRVGRHHADQARPDRQNHR